MQKTHIIQYTWNTFQHANVFNFLILSSAFEIGLKRFPFCEKFNLVQCKQLITVDTSWKLTRGSFLLHNNNIAKILHKNINNSSIDNNNNNNCNILSLLQSIFKMYLLIEYLGCGVLTWWTQKCKLKRNISVFCCVVQINSYSAQEWPIRLKT